MEASQRFTRHVSLMNRTSADVRVLFAHFCLMGAIKKYHEQITKTGRFRNIDKIVALKGKVPLKPTDWVCHPLHQGGADGVG